MTDTKMRDELRGKTVCAHGEPTENKCIHCEIAKAHARDKTLSEKVEFDEAEAKTECNRWIEENYEIGAVDSKYYRAGMHMARWQFNRMAARVAKAEATLEQALDENQAVKSEIIQLKAKCEELEKENVALKKEKQKLALDTTSYLSQLIELDGAKARNEENT